jgi:S1-C subfamily serine protease
MNIFNKEKKIIKIIDKVVPAVVSIIVSDKKEDNKIFNLNDLPLDDDIKESGGSGFIVEKNGLILTNRHVVTKDSHYYAVLNSGEKYEAKILDRDPLNDLALLKIDTEKELPTIPLGDSDTMKLGKTVLALGNVMGLFKNTVSAGIVSGLSRSITAQIDKDDKPSEMRGLIQTDAAINPGNSGGPLINLSGEAVGINVAMIAGLENVGFALPINIVKRDLKEIKKSGKITRPFFGVRYLTINKEFSKKIDSEVDFGALVVKGHSFNVAVIKDSPADKSGIKEGDIILTWNKNKITTENSIQDYLSKSEIGEKVDLEILRDGENINTVIELTERK